MVSNLIAMRSLRLGRFSFVLFMASPDEKNPKRRNGHESIKMAAEEERKNRRQKEGTERRGSGNDLYTRSGRGSISR